MTPDACRLMASYNRWMNARLYDASATLPETELHADRGAFFGSLFGTLNHVVVADVLWLGRFARHPDLDWLTARMHVFPRPATLDQPMATTLSDLRRIRDAIDEVIVAFADRVSEPVLASTLHYANTAGAMQARNMRALAQHFFNHQTHHRGQATTLLAQAGVDVGVTDLLALIPQDA